MSRAEYFQLECWYISRFDQFLKHSFSSFGILKVILNFFWFKYVKVILLCRNFLLIWIHHLHCVLRLQIIKSCLLWHGHIVWCLNLTWSVLANRSDPYIAVRICRIGRSSIATPLSLILRIDCSISALFICIRMPLTALLLLDQVLHIFLHRLSQLTISIQRCIVRTVYLCVLVVYIHATSAWKVTIANYETLQNKSVNDDVLKMIEITKFHLKRYQLTVDHQNWNYFLNASQTIFLNSIRYLPSIVYLGLVLLDFALLPFQMIEYIFNYIWI